MSASPFWRVRWQINGEPAADLYTPAAGRARAIAQAIATAHGARMILADLTNDDTIEYAPARQNPTLHHHGASRARWHVLTHGDNHAVADLYGFQPQAAARLVQAMATELGRRLVIVSNDNAPDGSPLHAHSVLRAHSGAPYHEAGTRANPHRGPRPVAGQTWRGIIDGARDRVVSVVGSRVQVLHTESGNREWLDLGEFVATHKPAGATRKNPKRTKVYGCKLHSGAHDYSVCPKCKHQYCPKYWSGCPSCAERSIRTNPGRDIHRAAPAVGSYWTRLSHPQHIARVVAVRRAAGGAPPMVRLDIVTGRGQVMGSTELPLEDVLQGYEQMPASSPYRKTLPNPRDTWADFLQAIDNELARRGMLPITADESDGLLRAGWGSGHKTVPGNALMAIMMQRGQTADTPQYLYGDGKSTRADRRGRRNPKRALTPQDEPRGTKCRKCGAPHEGQAAADVFTDDQLAEAAEICPACGWPAFDNPGHGGACACREVQSLPSPGVYSVDDGWEGFHSPDRCWIPHESTMGLAGGLGNLVRRMKSGELRESAYSRRPKWTKENVAGNIERDGGDGGPFPLDNPSARACACAAITPPNKLVWKLGTGYEGVHSWGRCWAPNLTDRGGVETKAGGARKSTRGVPGWVQSALDEGREFDNYGPPATNPTVRISGTINVASARRGRSKRPARSSRPKLAVVPRARAKRGRTEHARRALEAGEGVTVPYTGRSSYFGRPVKRTTEPATVLGYTDSSAGGRLVQVQVRRGKSAEVHEFPEHQVRRRPSRANRYKSEIEKHPEVRQRLEAAVAGDQSKGLHLLELAHSELEASNLTAEALRPQAGERPSPDYMAARRAEKKALARTQALEGIVQRIQRSAPGYQDPFAIANRRHNPRGQRAKAEKTFRMWHEFESSRTTKVSGPDPVIPGTLVKLGDLISVTYRSDKYAGGPDNPSGKALLYEHKTKSPHPVLATDPEGKFVHIVGGRMKVTGDGLVN